MPATAFSQLDKTIQSQINERSSLPKIKSVFELRINPEEYDPIIGFNSKTDIIALDLERLPANIEPEKLKVIKTAKKLNAARSSKTTLLIYERSTGSLFLDANRRQEGLGADGGLLAVIEGAPSLSQRNIAFISRVL